MPLSLKLRDTYPASRYQREALALFRGLPLRHVNGATVSDYYGGSELLVHIQAACCVRGSTCSHPKWSHTRWMTS